jgi:HK97 family phage portal protein
MNFLDRLPRPKALSPTDDSWYYPGGAYYGGLPDAMGLPTGPESASRLITVQNCIRVRAATMAQIPCHIFEDLGEDDFREATEYPLYTLLNDKPNSWMQSPIFWAMVEAFICTRGNFIGYKVGLPGLPTREIIPITDKVTKVEQGKDYSLTYHVQYGAGDIRPIPQDKVIHFRGLLTFDGIMGVNPIEYSRETIGLGRAQVEFLSRYFGKGMHPGAIITTPFTLGTKDYLNQKEAFSEKYAGLGKSSDLMLLEKDMKIDFPTIKLVDAQYLELMKMTESQICGLYRVPQILVQAGDKTSTWPSSAEQLMINYCVIGVSPDCRNYEKTIDSSLIPAKDQKKYYSKFEMRGLLRGSFKEQVEGFASLIDKEVMNPNEVRRRMEMRPYRGGEIYKTRTSTTKDKDSNTPATPEEGGAQQ